MKFYSKAEWEFIQAVAKRDLPAIQKLLQENEFCLNREFYIPDIDDSDQDNHRDCRAFDEELPPDNWYYECKYEVNKEFLDIETKEFIYGYNGCSYTPLSLACHESNLELVQLLVEAGADVNYEPDSPYIMYPIQVASKEIAKCLITKGVDTNSTNELGISAVQDAISDGDTELAILLLENGADPESALRVAIEEKNEMILDKIIELGLDISICLENLVMHGLNHYVDMILRSWQTITNEEQNKIDKALYAATEASNKEIISLLLASGANPNFKNILDFWEIQYGVPEKFKTAIELAKEKEDMSLLALFSGNQ